MQHDLKKIEEIVNNIPYEYFPLEHNKESGEIIADCVQEYAEHIRKQTIEECKGIVILNDNLAGFCDKGKVLQALNELE